MQFVVITIILLFTLACSTAASILAFMIGRCGRKLPIDGMLPRVVHSARFSPEKDTPHPAPDPAQPIWPHADQILSTTPRTADAPPPQNSKLCTTIDITELMPKACISAVLERTCALEAGRSPVQEWRRRNCLNR